MSLLPPITSQPTYEFKTSQQFEQFQPDLVKASPDQQKIKYTWSSTTVGYSKDLNLLSGSPMMPSGADTEQLRITLPDRDMKYDRLFSAWSDKMQHLFSDWDLNLLKSSISTSERYLLALQKSPDHRLFVASLLNAIRFNDIARPLEAIALRNLLKTYDGKKIDRRQTIAFIRSLRQIGLTPSVINKDVDVEQA